MADESISTGSAPAAEITESTPEQTIETLEAAPAEGEETRTDAEIEADKTLTKAEKVVEKRLKKLTLKYNGQEYDEELPFEIPDDAKSIEYMKKHLQMSKLSQSKSQDLSTLEKQIAEFAKALKEDPESVLTDPAIGIDMKKLAAKIIERDIENSKKTPEQIKLEEAQSQLKKLQSETKREKEEAKKRDFDKMIEQSYQMYETQLNEALSKTTLPKSPAVVNKIADYMEFAVKNKIQVSVSDIMPIVEADFREELKQMFSVMPEDVIEEFVGKEVFNKVRKKNLAKAKAAQPPTPVKAAVRDVGQTGKVDKEAKPKQSFKQFFGV